MDKEEKRVYNKRYREKNKETLIKKEKIYRQRPEIKVNYKIYRETYKEEIANRKKKYRKENKEKILKREKKYRKDNKEKISKKAKEGYKNNREKILARGKSYIQTEKGKVSVKRHNSSKNSKIRNKAHKLKVKLMIDIGKCEICGLTENLELHHIQYINERKFILLLCKKCHDKEHSKLRGFDNG